MADYYAILGLPRTATPADIRQAYVRLARERHPDRFSDPAERDKAQEFFKDLTAAFNTLGNPRSRQEYDAALDRPPAHAPEVIASGAYQEGLKRLEARAYHEAAELFRTAVQQVPGEARYHSALAQVLSKNPHWAREAVQEAERAAQLDPRAAAHPALLAELLLAQGLRLRARKAAEAALRLDPEEARALRVMEETAPEDGDSGPAAGGLLGRLRKKP